MIIIACSYSQFTHKSTLARNNSSPKLNCPEVIWTRATWTLDIIPVGNFVDSRKIAGLSRWGVNGFNQSVYCLLHVQNHFVRNEINKSKNYSFFSITNYISGSEYYWIHYRPYNESFKIFHNCEVPGDLFIRVLRRLTFSCEGMSLCLYWSSIKLIFDLNQWKFMVLN